MRFGFLTSTPLDYVRGSGTFAGIETLARALRALGIEVDNVPLRTRLPVVTAERLLYNEQLRRACFDGYDLTVGFDMDGYRLAARTGVPHIASIKGVIADELRFERGLTRRMLSLQAACEARHVRRARRVVTTSRYAAGRLRKLYHLNTEPAVVPELIDLARWRELFLNNPAPPQGREFIVLSVCRFYPRKRLNHLLTAAHALRDRVPGLQVRIVGNGPEAEPLRRQWRELGLQGTVHWLGDVSTEQLASEYNGCDAFCLPSVQEGFGIVFLEAMAAGKPVIGARAAAVPEVIPHGLLVEPESPAALAAAIEELYANPSLRTAIAEDGRRRVSVYDAPAIARMFLDVVAPLISGAPGYRRSRSAGSPR